MKFICLGYYDEKKWEGMPENDMLGVIDGCFTYDAVLRENGHYARHPLKSRFYRPALPEMLSPRVDPTLEIQHIATNIPTRRRLIFLSLGNRNSKVV